MPTPLPLGLFVRVSRADGFKSFENQPAPLPPPVWWAFFSSQPAPELQSGSWLELLAELGVPQAARGPPAPLARPAPQRPAAPSRHATNSWTNGIPVSGLRASPTSS